MQKQNQQNLRKSLSILLGFGAIGFIFQSCAGESSSFDVGNGSGSGSTVTTFVKGDGAWSVAPVSGQGSTTQILSGKLRSVTASYPDLVVLTNSGAYLFSNLIPSNSLGWASSGRITGTEAGVRAGALYDFDLEGNTAKDQNLDFLAFINSPRSFSIFKSNGDGSFTNDTANLPFASAIDWVSVANYEDRQKDTSTVTGKNRLWVAGSATGSVHGRFSVTDSLISLGAQSVFGNTIASGVKVLASDFDQDGDADFVLVPTTGNTFSVLTNQDDASFVETVGSARVPRTNTSAIQDAVLGDMDRDGLIDLVLATADGVEVYINISDSAGSVSFQDRTSLLTFGGVDVDDWSWMQYQDVTEDQIPDFVIVTNSGDLKFFSGSSGNAFAFTEITSTAFNSSELQSDLARAIVIDVDRDRVPDLVMIDDAGNLDTFFNNADDSADTDV